GISIHVGKLSAKLSGHLDPVNARRGPGIVELKALVTLHIHAHETPLFPLHEEGMAHGKELRDTPGVESDHEAHLFVDQPECLQIRSPADRDTVASIRSHHNFFPGKFQGAETIQRFGYIQNLLNEITLKPADDAWKSQSRAI